MMLPDESQSLYLLVSQEDRKNRLNPYNVNVPAAGSLFVGRSQTFRWIERQLTRVQFLFLVGPRHSGKSSILKRLEQGQSSTPCCFIYISCNMLSLHNASHFLWSLTRAAAPSLQGHGMSVGQTSRSDFAANPRHAFEEQFLQPLLSLLKGRRLVLMLDDATSLGEDRPGHLPARSLRELLAYFSQEYPRLHYLFALTGRVGTLSHMDLGPAAAAVYGVGPLDRTAVSTLLRQPAPYKVFDEVVEYIYNVTGGYPCSVQKVGQALFRRWQKNSLGLITIGDVVAVIRNHPDLIVPNQSQGAQVAAVVRTPSEPYQHKALARRTPTFYLAVSTLLLIALLMLLPSVRRHLATGPGTAGTPFLSTAATASAAAQTEGAAAVIRSTLSASSASLPAATTATPVRVRPLREPPAPVSDALVTPAATAQPTLQVREPDGMPMVFIPGGTFVMGWDSSAPVTSFDQLPPHEVRLDPFYIDEYEVSAAKYAAFLSDLGDFNGTCDGHVCALPRHLVGRFSYLVEEAGQDGRKRYSALEGYANHPVNQVSWYGANAYCRSAGARLPTEAEWEYAARGDDGRIYPWGNEAPTAQLALFNTQGFSELLPVDALPAGASPFGVYGMAGSMWEWVADWYGREYYADSPRLNPAGPDNGIRRVTRGGAWPNNIHADRIRATYRNPLNPDYINASLGFRCAQSP